MPNSQLLAVVTGASSGIGRTTAEVLAARGFQVLAGVRRAEDAERLAGDGIEPVTLDVTDAAQVQELASRVQADREQRHLGALVNNAGISINGPVETIPMPEWRRQFDVNFFGHVAVTQALLPALIAGGGRVVNISSIGGRVVGPTFGAYAASKFAIEAMSDALRREVGRLGVRVIVIEPGTVATPIWAKGTAAAEKLLAGIDQEQARRYGDLIAAVRKVARSTADAGIAPTVVANVIADAIESGSPRARYLVGRDAKVMARVARLLPDRAVDRLIAKRFGLSSPAASGAAAASPQTHGRVAAG